MSSRYEKYVIRKPEPPNVSINWGRTGLGVMAPFHFLSQGGPLGESNTMLEYTWVTKDSAAGVTVDRGPHRHDCPELFVFFGTNPDDPDDLGAEVEFWMGEGDETEKIKINTSSLVYVPKNLLHMPLFCRNVRRPFLLVIIALSIGDALGKTIRYPPRDV